MGVFPFIIALVLITTIGKVISERQSTREFRGDLPRDLPKIGPGEIESIQSAMEELSGRVVRLEEERDFYKNLLESPRRADLSPPPQAGPSDGNIV